MVVHEERTERPSVGVEKQSVKEAGLQMVGVAGHALQLSVNDSSLLLVIW